VIGGLAVFYRSTSEDIDASLVYSRGDCSFGDAHHVAELESMEFITKVTIRSSNNLVHKLGFETNAGRKIGPFGHSAGDKVIEYAQPGLSYLHDINYDTVRTQGRNAICNLRLRWISFS
jgi:hypothetical protein